MLLLDYVMPHRSPCRFRGFLVDMAEGWIGDYEVDDAAVGVLVVRSPPLASVGRIEAAR
jgi:hypothetical protein